MVVVFAPDLLDASVEAKREFRPYTSIIKLLLPMELIKILYPRLRTSSIRQKIVMSVVAVMVSRS